MTHGIIGAVVGALAGALLGLDVWFLVTEDVSVVGALFGLGGFVGAVYAVYSDWYDSLAVKLLVAFLLFFGAGPLAFGLATMPILLVNSWLPKHEVVLVDGLGWLVSSAVEWYVLPYAGAGLFVGYYGGVFMKAREAKQRTEQAKWEAKQRARKIALAAEAKAREIAVLGAALKSSRQVLESSGAGVVRCCYASLGRRSRRACTASRA